MQVWIADEEALARRAGFQVTLLAGSIMGQAKLWENAMPDVTDINKQIKIPHIAIGFFGWIIFHNLSLLFYVSDEFYAVMIYTVAVIAPLVLYSIKRAWISVGIILAFIVNSGLYIYELSSSGFGAHVAWWFWVVLPYPLGAMLLWSQ